MNICTVCTLAKAKFQWKNVTFYLLKSVQKIEINIFSLTPDPHIPIPARGKNKK